MPDAVEPVGGGILLFTVDKMAKGYGDKNENA
jgi:hypothetical protein